MACLKCCLNNKTATTPNVDMNDREFKDNKVYGNDEIDSEVASSVHHNDYHECAFMNCINTGSTKKNFSKRCCSCFRKEKKTSALVQVCFC